MTTPVKIALMAASLLLGVAGLVRFKRIALPPSEAEEFPREKKRRRRFLLMGAAGLWLFAGLVIGLFYRREGGLHVDVFAPRVMLLGHSVSTSVIIGWIVMALILIPAILLRIFVIPRFQPKAKGIQAALETMIAFLTNYTREKTGFVSEPLNAYILTLALFLTGCGVVELVSIRPPTADLIMTVSLALVTFIMIQYYGIRHKGLSGRLRSLAQPTAVVFPFKLLSDIATPVSLACRLFGNMLGGMIVMHLVYMALGAFGVGAPAVLGLYFNVFHPLIQVFIFVTLTLTFIGEAAE